MDAIQLGEILFDDNYSLESLLSGARQHGLSLGDLRQMLAQYQQDLNQKSLDLFDNNYDKFYKLSSIIACLNEPIQHLLEPIVDFKARIVQLCDHHNQYLERINHKLSALEETTKNKEYCRRLIELIGRRDRIEKQVNNIDWSAIRAIDGTNPAGHLQAKARDQCIQFQTKCDHLERVSVELYYLSHQVQAIRPTHDELIPIRRALQVGLEERQLQIEKWFEGAFLEAVELQDSSLINLVVRTYQQKDALDRIVNVWRNKILRPYLSLTVTDVQLASQTAQTYNLLLEFLKRNGELIDGKFIVRSFWLEVVEALDKLDKIYSLDNLDNFKSRYEATQKFLGQMDNQFSDESPIGADLMAHSRQKILGKFNLKGYFNHRLSQIASSVESGLTANPLGEIPDQPRAVDDVGSFKTKICMHIYVLITKCWSSELYIDTLEFSFVQLACRILNRFANWLAKLRLSDFRITGSSSLDKQTNFLAKQDAIMRLLIQDCDRLSSKLRQFFTKSTSAQQADTQKDGDDNKQTDPNGGSLKMELICESLKALSVGLGNVQSLQRLIER